MFTRDGDVAWCSATSWPPVTACAYECIVETNYFGIELLVSRKNQSMLTRYGALDPAR